MWPEAKWQRDGECAPNKYSNCKFANIEQPVLNANLLFHRQAALLRIGAIFMVIAAHYLLVNGERIEFNCFEEGMLKPGRFFVRQTY